MGDLPAVVLRLFPLDLAQPAQVLQDWRIAALKGDRDLCTAVLKSPLVEAHQITDKAHSDGCGWSNSVRITQAGGAKILAEPLTCPMAAALTLWMTHEVQPAAKRLLGRQVVKVTTFGSYACRAVAGNAYVDRLRALKLPLPLSQHASANAIDIAEFGLEGGEKVSVVDWPKGGPKAEFLRAVHAGACRIFRVVLGPDANQAHSNHFHLDRGPWRACD